MGRDCVQFSADLRARKRHSCGLDADGPRNKGVLFPDMPRGDTLDLFETHHLTGAAPGSFCHMM